LWDDGLVRGGECGCHRPIPSCPFWTDVLRAAFGAPERRAIDPRRVAVWQREGTRVRDAPRLLAAGSLQRSGNPASERYGAILARLYRAIAAVAGAAVVVDTSKRAGDAALVRLIPGIDVRYVHLVRDPRAVAESWRKRDPAGHGPAATSRDWVAFNLLFEAVRGRHGSGRTLRVRHEEFVRRPRTALEAIVRVVGAHPEKLPLADEHTVHLPEAHTVLGNPVRFSTGDVPIRVEADWRATIPAAHRRIVTAISAPLLLRYGYPIASGPRRAGQ
jgi:hypothetical protein